MKARVVATILWFVTGWGGASFLVAVLGLPSPLALLGGVVAGAILWFDPWHWLWARDGAGRRVRPIEEVAAELQAQANVGATEGVEHRVG